MSELECNIVVYVFVKTKCLLIRGEVPSADNLGCILNTITSNNKIIAALKTNNLSYTEDQEKLKITVRNIATLFSIPLMDFTQKEYFLRNNCGIRCSHSSNGFHMFT